MFVDLENDMVDAFGCNMTTDINVNLIMHVMCRKGLDLLGRDNCQWWKTQTEDKYKKVSIERLMKGP
jgi:hypothetical protein